jgi:hypothetical protein
MPSSPIGVFASCMFMLGLLLRLQRSAFSTD